jgi:predicted nucleic acid-binding protein
MEWIRALHGTVVGLDTASIIYLIEENPTYLPIVRPFFEAVDRGYFQIATSILTLTEVLVHPLRNGDKRLADQYRRILLQARHITTIPFSERIAEQSAKLRAYDGLRTPDAIQVAPAVHSGASSFLTNDARLSRVSSLNVLVLDQLIPKGTATLEASRPRRNPVADRYRARLRAARLRAALRACCDSASCDAAERPSLFSAAEIARERFADVLCFPPD